ncbi:MAG: acetate--CoA ligase family protein [Alphaproteobacteria bacterium]|nr:acetate--CoA ligase family protein [Alphaproteobacteria bacterium]
MKPDLSRLLRPRSIAIIGGGSWCKSVITQCTKMGFSGDLWPVHPKAEKINDLPCFSDLSQLPAPPDAVFIGVNRHATIEIVARLRSMGAGGAVCFASGFLEAAAEDANGVGLQNQLLAAAGDLPIFGPNCYGFINYLDGALLWPDQHGGQREDTGVAIITQSSNIAVNLTMQKRALPLAYVVTAGNQAQIGIAEIGMALLDDPRVTALGLHIEGFGNLRAFEALAAKARDLQKPVVALKVGKSAQAQIATISHTASLAGSDAGAQAFLHRLGFARVESLPVFMETLKLLHVVGPLPNNRLASISCSGGEASLCADLAVGRDVCFPPLNHRQTSGLHAALGPMVALANPLDYHTYIWNNAAAMTTTFAAMMDPTIGLTLLVVDFPRDDRCSLVDWQCAITAAADARRQTGAKVAMVATLPENMPEETARQLLDEGIVPLLGLDEALAAAEVASKLWQDEQSPPVLLPGNDGPAHLVTEARAKELLAKYGVSIPASRCATSPEAAAEMAAQIGYPVVLKGEGIAHKTESGAVCLGLFCADAVIEAAHEMPAERFLIEEMIVGTVAELLIGVHRDPAHGYVLTLAAGGVLSELLDDRKSLLVPASEKSVAKALKALRIAPLLDGYRGKPAADRGAIVATVMALQDFVLANSDGLEEVEINPLLCGGTSAVAADALLRCKDSP